MIRLVASEIASAVVMGLRHNGQYRRYERRISEASGWGDWELQVDASTVALRDPIRLCGTGNESVDPWDYRRPHIGWWGRLFVQGRFDVEIGEDIVSIQDWNIYAYFNAPIAISASAINAGKNEGFQNDYYGGEDDFVWLSGIEGPYATLSELLDVLPNQPFIPDPPP